MTARFPFVPALVALVASFLVGCPPHETPEDAASSPDAPDAWAPDAPPDALGCSLTCSTTLERCCRDAEGVAACIDVSSDVSNCGVCGLDCVASHRGDRCITMQCSCGAFSIGCTGEDDSTCCPPAADGRAERCANIGRDFQDCGGCGRVCEPSQANRCEGGQCYCGTDGARCAGTETDLCCVDVFEVASCVDTTTDDLHCGGCNRRCRAFEHCMDSVCVDFTIPDAGPPDAAISADAATSPDAG